MSRGITQGSPLSPHSSNLYIDRLIEEARDLGTTRSVVITLFADDVVGFSFNTTELQKLHDLCSDWACRYGLRWSLTKFTALRTRKTTAPSLALENQNIKDEEDTEYLNTSLIYDGTSSNRGLCIWGAAMKQFSGLKTSYQKRYIDAGQEEPGSVLRPPQIGVHATQEGDGTSSVRKIR